jgi:predicted nucleic acid-binding protein
MVVLDTDHLRVLQSRSSRAQQLLSRLEAQPLPVYTTIVSAHENVKGWQDEANKASRRSEDLIRHYEELQRLLAFYRLWRTLPFDASAASEWERLTKMRLGRLNALDLRIAAIVRSQPAFASSSILLLSGDGAFGAVPGLRVEDWRPP